MNACRVSPPPDPLKTGKELLSRDIDDIRSSKLADKGAVPQSDEDCILKDIKDSIAVENIVIFIKGTPEKAMCGFSKRVTDILDAIQVEYVSFNVLAHPSIITGAKSESQWPTFPQVFVKGEFVGGCDVFIELAMRKELFTLLDKKKIKYTRVEFT